MSGRGGGSQADEGRGHRMVVNGASAPESPTGCDRGSGRGSRGRRSERKERSNWERQVATA